MPGQAGTQQDAAARSLLQMTYSLTRFAIYETARDRLGQGSQGPPPFYQKVLLGAVGGERGRGTLGPGSLWLEEPRPQLSSGRRFHRRLCGNPGGHGERQVSSAGASSAAGEGRLLLACSWGAGLLPVCLASLLPQPPRGPWPGPGGDLCVWQAKHGSCPSAGPRRRRPGAGFSSLVTETPWDLCWAFPHSPERVPALPPQYLPPAAPRALPCRMQNDVKQPAHLRRK